MHVVIHGGGSAIAQGLVERLLFEPGGAPTKHRVTAVCRSKRPVAKRTQSGMVPECKRLECVSSCSEVAGDVDSLVTLAGSFDNNKLTKVTDEQWGRVLEDCLSSTFRAVRDLAPRIACDGSVVIVGSVVGSMGGRGCANYAAAKAGLVGLMRSAAAEFAKAKVRVNLLELGYINAGMGLLVPPNVRQDVCDATPLKRFGTIDEACEAIAFLIRAPFMTGEVLRVAGGLR